jgi:adenylylsulfate kinase
MERNVPVVVITGTIGAGKSTIAGVASEILHARGIRHGLIEVDNFGGVYPPPDPNDGFNNEFSMRNIAALWPAYLDAGITKAIVTMTLESHDDTDELLASLGSPPATVVRLEASQGVREERIRQREFGDLRDHFLKRTGFLAEKMEAAGIGDIVVTNEEEPRLVATRLLEKLGWI